MSQFGKIQKICLWIGSFRWMKIKHFGIKTVWHLYKDCPKYKRQKRSKGSILCRFCFVRKRKEKLKTT